MNYIGISEFIKEKYLNHLENFEIKNLQDVRNFHDELIKVRVDLILNNGFYVMPHYRGERKYGRDVVPGIFRPPFSTDIDLKQARKIEENGALIFKKKVIEKYDESLVFKHSVKPYGEIWDLLFQAQHAGVKTNLIDLSTSSILSSFFICEPSIKHENSDGQLWSLLVPTEFIFNETSEYDKFCYPELNPYVLDKSFVCNVPTYIDDIDERTYQFRLFRQNGRLFASSNVDLDVPLNKKDFWKNLMLRVRVPADVKKIIFEELVEAKIDRKKMMIIESPEADKIINDVNNEMKKL